MPVVNIPKILRDRLSEEGAMAIIELFNQIEENARDTIVKFSEEKYERRLVEVTADLKLDFEEKLLIFRADIIKWMFIFWATQMTTIIGLFLVLIKK